MFNHKQSNHGLGTQVTEFKYPRYCLWELELLCVSPPILKLISGHRMPTKVYIVKTMVFPVVVYGHVQFSSVAQSCPTLRDPMNRSTPGLPVHHQLPEFTQTHVHRVSDAIQPSHPLSSPSPPAPNPSQHQSLFQ